MSDELQTIEREYHDCLIVSTETGEGMKLGPPDEKGERPVTSDGYDHEVRVGRGRILDSTHGTLAAAVRRAKEIKSTRDAAENADSPPESPDDESTVIEPDNEQEVADAAE